MLPLSLFACNDAPPTPAEVRSAISTDLGNVLQRSSAALAGGTDALPGSAALTMLEHLLGTPALLPVQTMAAHLVKRTGDDAAPVIDADTQTRYLNAKLFTDANHVGDGIFQIPASLVCTRTTTDASGTSHDTVDAACVEQVTKVDLRIRTTSEDGALVFALQVDAAHDEPLRLTLSHTSIALTVDLDGMQHAFVALAAVAGSDAPNAELAGAVTAKLEALGTAKAKISFAIDRAISIRTAAAGVDLAGPGAFSLTSPNAEVVSFTLDGAAKTGALAVALGRTEVNVPGRDGGPRTDVVLAGLALHTVFAADQPLALTDVSLGNGTTFVALDGVRAVSLDVNFGGRFDLTLSHDAAAGTSTLAVAPRLDVQLAIDHAVLGDDAPVYDVTQLQLEGSVRGRDDSAQLEVVTGALAIKTNPERYGFTAAAGQCVTSSDASDPTTGAPFTQWAVGACL
ncbi:MAG: hypothetical protein ABIY55_17835 [Kofleriaceae bacterium]